MLKGKNKMLKMERSVVKILEILFWVLKMKGRVNVLFRRRGIMPKPRNQRLVRRSRQSLSNEEEQVRV
jgi:hypothetical protein